MPDLPSATADEHPPAGDAVLRIVCPTQKRMLPVLVGAFLLLFLLPATFRNLRRAPDDVSWLPLVVLAVMCLLVLAMLYRSFVFRDALCIYKGGDVPDGMLVVAAGSIRSVRALPAPQAWSAEGKWDALGMYPGPIEIDTDSGAFRFGAGLSGYMVGETVDRIAAFCSLAPEGWRSLQQQ